MNQYADLKMANLKSQISHRKLRGEDRDARGENRKSKIENPTLPDGPFASGDDMVVQGVGGERDKSLGITQ